jgi:hypothetical protein
VYAVHATFHKYKDKLMTIRIFHDPTRTNSSSFPPNCVADSPFCGSPIANSDSE